MISKIKRISLHFFSLLMAIIISFDSPRAEESNTTDWFNHQSVEQMYDEHDLVSCPLFAGGFINFGYWSRKNKGEISKEERLESEKNLYRVVLKKMEIISQDKILEVGCGLGLGAVLALEEFAPQEVRGIDFVKTQVVRANEMNKEAIASSNICFSQGSAENIPFPRESFEKMISIEAAQHFVCMPSFIKEAYRVLKPGGKLAVSTFFAKTSASPKKIAPLIKTVEQGIDKMIPIADFEKELKAAGFKNISIENIGDHVWYCFDQWIAQQDELKTSWDRNWFKAYKQNLLDYYIVTAEK